MEAHHRVNGPDTGKKFWRKADKKTLKRNETELVSERSIVANY